MHLFFLNTLFQVCVIPIVMASASVEYLVFEEPVAEYLGEKALTEVEVSLLIYFHQWHWFSLNFLVVWGFVIISKHVAFKTHFIFFNQSVNDMQYPHHSVVLSELPTNTAWLSQYLAFLWTCWLVNFILLDFGYLPYLILPHHDVLSYISHILFQSLFPHPVFTYANSTKTRYPMLYK